MKFNNVEIKNSIFTNLTMLSGEQDITISNLPEIWSEDTLFNCDFDTLFAGNPDSFNVENIISVRVKRREVLSDGIFGNWIILLEKPVTSYEDLIFTYRDYYNKNATTYQYGISEIYTNGVEGITYIGENIFSCFDKVFIVDKNISYNLNNATSYSNYQRNQEIGAYTTFGRKYPLTVMNGSIDYNSMTTSAYLIYDEDDAYINRPLQTKYEKEFVDFLTNKKAKILKDYNGNICLISISKNPTIKPIQQMGNTIAYIDFSWNEIGDVENEKDLQKAGMLTRK